ncbi:MAG: hypothetical protein AAF391_03290, partial [Bacteroidota bacterium]
MNNLNSFFINGWEHIVDINAYDHLLFVMTLCAAFKLWCRSKKLAKSTDHGPPTCHVDHQPV